MLLCALTIMALPAQAQLLKKVSKNIKKTFSSAEFNADDPFAEENLVTEGTPWETVSETPFELPEGMKATLPKALPDLSAISTIQYNMAVSVAFESLRLLYGEMSEADAEKFMKMWAPLFDHPTQEIIDYLNKLNPLLSQFIVARETYMNSLANIELLSLDIGEAVEWDDQEAFKSALFQAKVYSGNVKQMGAAMDELANRILALGNPPNPLEAKAKARQRYNRIFPKKEIYMGETWMGTRVDTEHSLPELGPLTEPMMRYLMKVKINGEDRWFVLELKEDGLPDNTGDSRDMSNIKVEQMVFSDTGYLMPDFKSDGTFQTYYPKPPVMAITMLTMELMRLYESSYVDSKDKEDVNFAMEKQEYHELAGHYGNRVVRAGIFFKTALLWGMEDKWSQYEWTDNGVVPFQLLEDFEEAVKKQAVIEAENSHKLPKFKFGGKKKQQQEENVEEVPKDQAALAALTDPNAARKQQVRDSIAREEESKKESIQQREELIKMIEANIRRDEEGRRGAMQRLSAAKTAEEKRWIQEEIQSYDMRIMHQRSDIQSERDNIRSMQTGQFVHTRSDFDNYAFNKMIHDSKVEAERYNMTKKAASIIDRQINLLPEEERDAARDRADKLIYEDGALASGDYEKVRKLGNAFNHQIVGSALKDAAEAEDEIAWADLKEAGANAVIMAGGAVTGSLATEALAASYGATAAATVWGTRAVGAVYSGVTGYIAGGPGKAASSIAGALHPATGAVASFVEGFVAEGNEGKTFWEKSWEGAKQAGMDFIIGKGMEVGATAFAKTAAAVLPDGIVHFNLTAKQIATRRTKADIMRTQRERLDAEDAVKAFTKMNDEYIHVVAEAKATGKAVPEATLEKMRTDIRQTAAALNSDYHAKWYLKYKANPMQRAHFDQAVQANYREMYPKITERMIELDYDMSDIEFKQFRNSSSSGSSSMDLDLAPVSIKNGKEPNFYKLIKKDGVAVGHKKVTPAEFMKDAQKAMDQVYFEKHHITTKASEMNLTTSAHPEAYSTDQLLAKDVDYSTLKPEDIASIGKVLEVKVNTIEGNVRMSQTTKLQAKCREATKELNNMLIPKLKQDLKNSTNYKQAEQISEDLELWTSLRDRLSEIGTKTSDPVKIHQLNDEITRATGGKDATQVVNDLIHAFGHK